MPGSIDELLRARRTVNLYEPGPVPPEIVHGAIEAATWAPNHHVTEPWHFYLMGDMAVKRTIDLVRDIVSEKKGEKKAEKKSQSWAEKPGWLVVTCRRNEDELREREDYAACCAAVQNLMLSLWQNGVGTKWTTGDITRDERFFDIVGIDGKREFVVGLIWYGYPRMVPEQKRKPLGKVLTELP